MKLQIIQNIIDILRAKKRNKIRKKAKNYFENFEKKIEQIKNKILYMRNVDTIKKLGHKVRIIRTDRGYSQETLAEKADLNRSFVGLLERGKTNITIKSLENIANALDIDIKTLFDFIL